MQGAREQLNELDSGGDLVSLQLQHAAISPGILQLLPALHGAGDLLAESTEASDVAEVAGHSERCQR